MRTRTRHRTGCAPPLSPSVWVLTCASAQIKERYPSTTPQQFMFYMNLWCSLYYTVYMFALTGVHAGAASRCIAPSLIVLPQALEWRRLSFWAHTPRRWSKCCCTASAEPPDRRDSRASARCLRGLTHVRAELHLHLNLQLRLGGQHHDYDDKKSAPLFGDRACPDACRHSSSTCCCMCSTTRARCARASGQASYWCLGD